MCPATVSFGITGKDYVLLASDTSAARSIVKMKGDEDKQREVGKHLVIACEFARASEPDRVAVSRRVISLCLLTPMSTLRDTGLTLLW